ncbi:MAG: YdcF family protein [Propionibacteriaceae bacterium]|nr:YdcF family protein [Propionibacteriaceae bacterium]
MAGKKETFDAQAGGAPTRRRRGRRVVMTILALIVLVAASPFIVVGAVSSNRILSVADVAPHDVAIVYGAGLAMGNKPSPYLAARLAVARDLYLAGKAKVILVSGDNLTPYHNEPAAMAEWLVEQGIPESKIVQDFAGEDTYTTCVRARVIFGVSSAILVSQTYHLPRAVTTCRLVGLDAVGVGDDTVKANDPGKWASYQVREAFADVNMLWQVITRRTPILGAYEPGVDHALGR